MQCSLERYTMISGLARPDKPKLMVQRLIILHQALPHAVNVHRVDHHLDGFS